jgi:hypothetical protein
MSDSSCSPDIFQGNVSDLMQNIEFVRTYFDDLLVIITSNFEDHFQNIDIVLKKLSEQRRVNFAQPKSSI